MFSQKMSLFHYYSPKKVIVIANYSNSNIFIIPYSTTKKGITTLFHHENSPCSFSTIPLQPLTIQMGKTDGRADGRANQNYEWCMHGWLELKNDMYPVSFNAVFYEMVTFANNNNNNNNNNCFIIHFK